MYAGGFFCDDSGSLTALLYVNCKNNLLNEWGSIRVTRSSVNALIKGSWVYGFYNSVVLRRKGQ